MQSGKKTPAIIKLVLDILAGIAARPDPKKGIAPNQQNKTK